MCRPVPLLLLLAAFLLACMGAADAKTVIATYALQRHGQRDVITQNTDDSVFGGTPLLAPVGFNQSWWSGLMYRSTYLNPATCNETCLVGADALNSHNVYVRPATLDRTIQTALMFINGALRPNITQANITAFASDSLIIPVWAQPANDTEDALLRTQTKCPAYDALVQEWTQSDAYRAKEAETAQLREAIVPYIPTALGSDVSLVNFWNIYNAVNARYKFLGEFANDTVVNSTYPAWQELAFWRLYMPLNGSEAGRLVGGPLLFDLLQSVDATVAAVQSGATDYRRVYHLVGQTEIQLGMLSALGYDLPVLVSLMREGSKVPGAGPLEPGASLLFEVHADEAQQQFAVLLKAQNRPSGSFNAFSSIMNQSIALPCSASGSDGAYPESFIGPYACTLEAFQEHLSASALDPAAWCAACQNNSTTVCQLLTAQAQLAGTGGSCSCSSDGWKIALSVVLTFLGTAALVGWGMWYKMGGKDTRWSKYRDGEMQMGEMGVH